jgi:hypothetical protein
MLPKRITLVGRDTIAALAQVGNPEAAAAERSYERADHSAHGSRARRFHLRAAERHARRALHTPKRGKR